MRVALFGGSFDPPHRGHVAIARAALTRLSLDRVLMAPVACQPLKRTAAHAAYRDRLAMVGLAVAGEPHLQASDIDGPRRGGGPNYTIDTLKGLRRGLGVGDELFCLVGADSFHSLRQWHRAADLLFVCSLIVASRPHFSLEDLAAALPAEILIREQLLEESLRCVTIENRRGERASLYMLPGLHEDVSATQVREALAAGASQKTVLVPGVVEYIRAHGLYGLRAPHGAQAEF